MINAFLVAAMVMDGAGRVQAVNPAFVALFGFETSTPEEVDVGVLFQDQPGDLIGQYLRYGMLAQPFGEPVQLKVRKRSGEVFSVELMIFPVVGNEVKYIGIVRHVGRAHEGFGRGLQAITKRVVEVQEEERRRIARDLHDETAQQMSALKMQLLSLKADGPETLFAGVPGITDGVDTILRDLRRVIMDLRPKILDDFGLHEALFSLVQDIEKRIELIIDYKPLGIRPDRRFPPEVELAAYRIVKEALNNIVKHSGASSVILRMSAFEHSLIIVLQDDGVGFNTDQVDVQITQGLSGMCERATILGGCVEIRSFQGRGTVVVVVLPLQLDGGNLC